MSKNAREYAKINFSNSCVINNRKVPVGAVYGKYRETVFICVDTKPHSSHLGDTSPKVAIEFFHQNRWKRYQIETSEPIYRLIMTAGDSCAKFGTGNVSTMTTHGPQAKKAQADFIRFKGSCYSQKAIEGKGYKDLDREEAVNDVVCRQNGKIVVVNNRGQRYFANERPYDPNKPFEVGQNTAGPAQFVPNRNSMYVHDTQKCRDEKKTTKVSGEIHSRKVDKFEHGAEYAVANYALSPEEAIKALVMGGLSREMGIKAYKMAH